ncbi:MAG: hypothetical protein HYR84_07695 [Planctomycetes bacterium]|nr:hypothetical protein [Planctomycetota bacterium]
MQPMAAGFLSLSLHDRAKPINPITRLALEKHDGPYETCPLYSRLYFDGSITQLYLPGYVLLHQFATPHGFILVTDHDCPLEETTNFALISTELFVLSCRWLGGGKYANFLLDRIEWEDDRTFVAIVLAGDRRRFAIRSWGIPYIWPRLRMQWLGQPAAAD